MKGLGKTCPSGGRDIAQLIGYDSPCAGKG